MRYRGFCGPSNPSQSPIANAERLVNWYPEVIQSPFAPTDTALYPTPGASPWYTASDVGTRAPFFTTGARSFTVIGTGFYELFSTATATRRGTVAQNDYPATISYNGLSGGQLFITSGANGYIYALSTNTLTQVLTGTATMGAMLDARFLAFDIATGTVRASDLNDGTTWNPLVYFQRTQQPDPWKAMIVKANEIWLLGERTGEVWYDAGNYPQPFAPIPGAVFSFGLAAPFAVTAVDEVVTWLTDDGKIVSARGYTPQPISNFAVETAIAGYARTSTIADAEVLAYSDGGHDFACWNFYAAKATWCHDFSQPGSWHERGKWNSVTGSYDAWDYRVTGYCFGKHLVGTRSTGVVSALDTTVGTEADGSMIRRLRIPPPLWAASPYQRIQVSRLDLMVETGVGLASGQGSDPKVMLRTSGDGKTWSAERMASAGRIGDYQRLVSWTRCGSSPKLWVPEIVVSDPIPWRLSGASIEVEGAQMGRAA